MTKLAILLRTSFLILTLICASQTMARSQKYKVTIKVKEQKLLDVFKSIQQQTNLIVFYSNTILNDQEKVSIQVKDEPLEKVLDKIIAGKALKYEVQEKYIVIAPKEEKKGVKEIKEGMSVEDVAPLPPPTIDVSGRVTDEDGNPLMGASVMIKGTKIGTQTNAEGYFTLKGVEEKAVLEISYVGFALKELSATAVKVARTIALMRNQSPLDEVQIIAYGQTSRRLTTGNTNTVTAAEIEKQPVQNALLALQGRVPGLEITQGTGMANGYIKVRIQGQNAIVDDRNEPLILVDGVPYPTILTPDFHMSTGPASPISGINKSGSNGGSNPLSFLNPKDIESIDVLKDADATAIYGSRGANGVILITTKKGKPGTGKMEVSIQEGFGKVTRRANMMNTRQYLDMRYEAYRNAGIDFRDPSVISNINDLKVWDTTRYTDWQKVLIGETASYTNVSANLSGGNTGMQYLLGATYSRVTDVLPGDFASKSGSLHFNINSTSLKQRFKMNLTGSYMYNNNGLPGIDLTEKALYLEPVAPALFNSDGTLNWQPNAAGTSTWINPLRDIFAQNFFYTTNNLVASLDLSYQILPGLTFRSNVGTNSMFNQTDMKSYMESERPEQRPNYQRTAYQSRSKNNSWIIEPQLNYRRRLNKLNIDLLTGGTMQKSSFSFLNVTAWGFSSDQLMGDFTSAPNIQGGSNYKEYRYAAFFGRANFNYGNKYILNLNARRDGSSRFGDANKFHIFKSVGAAWLFLQEPILAKSLSFLSFGKLRVSFGTTGSDAIPDYAYLSLYQSSVSPGIAYQGINGLSPYSLPNPNLAWEENRKASVGLDLGFIDDRIYFSVSYNQNRCSNQLSGDPLPNITGFSSITNNRNIVVQNTSWEFIVNSINIKNKHFTWNSSFNVTIPRNKLLAAPDMIHGVRVGTLLLGEPIGLVPVYNYAGVDPVSGVYLAYDRFGNPTPTPSNSTTGDRIDKIENIITRPTFYGGFRNSIQYKGVQLDFMFQFSKQLGQKLNYYNGRLTIPGRFTELSNQPVTVLEGRWQKPGDNALMARFSPISTTRTVNVLESKNGYSYDASFIRLKNIALSYNLPISWIRRAGFKSTQISFEGQNLLTITKYSGLDPETASTTVLPPLQMWTFNIRLGF